MPNIKKDNIKAPLSREDDDDDDDAADDLEVMIFPSPLVSSGIACRVEPRSDLKVPWPTV